jgi:xylulokinase
MTIAHIIQSSLLGATPSAHALPVPIAPPGTFGPPKRQSYDGCKKLEPTLMTAHHDRYVLAVDLGTSGCKCALAGMDGVVKRWAFRSVALHIVGENGAEQEPEEWWRALIGAAREVLALLREEGGEIAAICCSSQGECTVAVDRAGHPLHRAMSWMDMRGAAQIQRMAGGGWFSVTGYDWLKLSRWIRLTGGAPALSGKDPAGHMAYIRETWPEIYGQTYKFLNALDYLNLRLTGRFVATVDSILTSWVTDNRDPKNIHYNASLIRQSGIDAEKFPEIVRCTDVIGTLSAVAAAELDLPEQTPVVAGAVDNSAAAIGSGAVGDGEAHLYIGTSSWLGAHIPYKRTDVSAQIASVPCAIDGRYLAVALQSSAGSNLSFLFDQILFTRDEFGLERPADAYAAMEEIAASVPSGANGLLYMPWLFGERSPVDDANLRASLLNLSLQHTRGDVLRAVLEGVALNTRWMAGPFTKFLAKPLDRITLVGGGASSSLWCQIFADVLSLPVQQVQDPIQVNAAGAALIGCVGIGAISWNDVPSLVKIRHTYVPDAGRKDLYNELFSRFEFAYRRLAPLYRRMHRARSASR